MVSVTLTRTLPRIVLVSFFFADFAAMAKLVLGVIAFCILTIWAVHADRMRSPQSGEHTEHRDITIRVALWVRTDKVHLILYFIYFCLKELRSFRFISFFLISG